MTRQQFIQFVQTGTLTAPIYEDMWKFYNQYAARPISYGQFISVWNQFLGAGGYPHAYLMVRKAEFELVTLFLPDNTKIYY